MAKCVVNYKITFNNKDFESYIGKEYTIAYNPDAQIMEVFVNNENIGEMNKSIKEHIEDEMLEAASLSPEYFQLMDYAEKLGKQVHHIVKPSSKNDSLVLELWLEF